MGPLSVVLVEVSLYRSHRFPKTFFRDIDKLTFERDIVGYERVTERGGLDFEFGPVCPIQMMFEASNISLI
jgi:hypothetical protein